MSPPVFATIDPEMTEGVAYQDVGWICGKISIV
jgi:hypothetical protein